MKKIIVLSILLSLAALTFGLNIYGNLTLNSTNTTDLIGASSTVKLWQSPSASLSYIFDFQMVRNSLATPFYAYMTLDHYWYINNAYFDYSSPNLSVDLGRMDFIEGPENYYHLFLDDNAGPFNGISIEATVNKFFTFKQDMILLNDINPRSLYWREFVFHPTSKLSIAYEEAILFMRYFDPWYAFIPLPYAAIEVLRETPSPWAQNTSLNDNAFAGLWANYNFSDTTRVYSELLIDDFDMNMFFPGKFQNPNKIAWLIGGQTNIGQLQLIGEFAGATAYTFESTTGEPDYSYLAYPSWNNIDQNMIGYKYGENNAAVKVGLNYPISLGDLSSGILSFTYTNVHLGVRTPLVPWHGTSEPQGTYWLNDPVIETMNKFCLSAQMNFGNLIVEPALKYDNIQNVNLQSGVNGNLFSFSLTVDQKW
ncbi:hypothetical protein [Athalassotoga sp.]|uniref:hypothetical protein n=1 Tax=Athalassotoga sp. TaxID=2022597 RepID=UPI003CFF3152